MIRLQNVSKLYGDKENSIVALDNINIEIKYGEFTLILGPSGSGKSTLLNILGGMDRLSEGLFFYNEKNISELSNNELSNYRKNEVSFVFQFYNLIPSLTAYENVAIAAELSYKVEIVEELLERVGLMHRKNNFPSQLSGGEMQRVSIARALSKKTKLLLCDEPTGALDSKTGRHILEILKQATMDDTAVVMVTHNEDFIPYADKVIRLADGKITNVIENSLPVGKTEVNA